MTIAVLVLVFANPVLGHSAHDDHNSSVEDRNSEGEELFSVSGFELKGWMFFVLGGLFLAAVLFFKSSFVDRNFESLFTLGLLWFTFGAVADAYNHLNGAPVTFINLEHSIAYSGVMIVAGALVALMVKGWRKGELLSRIPDGYRLALLSPFIFALGGFGDMIWHQIFGFEVKAQQMLSPTHLTLGVAAILLVTGPLRQAWYTGLAGKNWRKQLPLLTSSALLLSLLSFMIQHFHPFVRPFGSSSFTFPGGIGEIASLMAISGIVLNTVFTVVLVLHLVERFDIVFGGLTYILGFNTLLMTVLKGHFEFLLVGLLTGLALDLIRRYYFISKKNVLSFRLFALSVPFILTSLYFLSLYLTGGIRWTVHVWTGVIFLSSAVGVVASYAVYPSARED